MILRTSKPWGKRGGIALLEVLLAATVVGVGVGASMQTLSTIARQQSRLEERQEARRLAQEILIDIEAGANRGPAAAEQTGNFDPPFQQYRWRTVRGESSNDGLFALVSVIVESRDGDRVIHRAHSLVPAG